MLMRPIAEGRCLPPIVAFVSAENRRNVENRRIRSRISAHDVRILDRLGIGRVVECLHLSSGAERGAGGRDDERLVLAARGI